MSYQDYIDSQNQQLLDDVLGLGGGDPDRWGYPHEHEPTCYLNINGGHGKNCDCKYSEGDNDE